LTGFGQGDEEGRFSRFDQLPPLVYLARATLETIPPIAASSCYFTRILVDEHMPQSPGVRAEEERIYAMFLNQFCLLIQ